MAHAALPLEAALTDEETPIFESRRKLAARLTDLVCLPTTSITPQERHIAGDLLLEMLTEGEIPLRQRCARRISTLVEAPSLIIRVLAKDVFEVAEPILRDSEAISDNDLVAAARNGNIEHRLAIASRRPVSELVADTLASYREEGVLLALVKNPHTRLSDETVNLMVAESRELKQLIAPLVRREELAPSQGLTLFWWAGEDDRVRLLRRFATERSMMQDSASDIFKIAAAENWQDPMTRKALQFIERRQRNRAALEKSPFESLEAAAEIAAEQGMDRHTAEEISYLCGIKPATGAKIFTDPGGEPLAILCKSTGLKRDSFDQLWRSLRREVSEPHADTAYARALKVFETVSNEKAQTVLRYWNWALTSAMAPSVAAAEAATARERDWADFSPAARAAHLVFEQK